MLTFGLVCQLQLLDPNDKSATDVAKKIIDEWLQQKLARNERAPTPKKFLPSQRSYIHGSSSVWEFCLAQNADHGGVWITEVRILAEHSERERACLTVAMRVQADDGQLAPVRYYVETPTFLRQLFTKFSVAVGGTKATSEPVSVTCLAEVEALIRDMQDSERGLPLIVVAEPARGPGPIPELGNRLATFFSGLANVVNLAKDATFLLTDAVGKEMSVFDGGVRVYWPQWSTESDIGRHPLFLRRRLEISALSDSRYPDRLIRSSLGILLTRAAASRFRYPDAMLKTISASLQRELKETLEAAGKNESVEQIVALSQQVQESKALEEVALAENAELRAQLDEGRRELTEARRELTRLRAKLAGIRNRAGEEDEAESPWDIEDPYEAIERARTDFESSLIIPDSVVVDTSQPGGWWYHALRALHQLCELDRRGEATNKRQVLQGLLAENGLAPKQTYKMGDTSVEVQEPGTGRLVECRERVHLVEGSPSETESIYWHSLGEARSSSRRYLIARIGRHA